MYQDKDLRPRWQQWLSIEWHLFRAFDVTVSMRWTTIIWPLILSWSFAEFFAIEEAIFWGLIWTIVLLTVTYTHEMGHIVAGRRLGVTTQRITLHALGGLAHLDSGAPNPKGELLISLAGPVTHIPWWILLYSASWIGELAAGTGPVPMWVYMVEAMAALQISMIVFNLLPFYPMDGGRCFRAILAMRMHPNRASLYTANLGFAGVVIFGLVGLASLFGNFEFLYVGEWALILVLIAITNFQECRRLQMEARWGEGPYEQVEDWKKGVSDPIEMAMAESRQLRADAGRADKKSRRKRKASRDTPAARQETSPKEPSRQDLHAEMDALLDRINEVGGVEKLSKSERRNLEELSRKLNG